MSRRFRGGVGGDHVPGDNAGDDDGMVTAEAAIALPCVVLALLGALSVVGAGAAKVTCTDAAGSAARALSRGDSVERARAVALAAAPGATVSLHRSADEVVVEVRRRVQGGGLLGAIGLTVSGRAVGMPEVGVQ